jgi:thiol:disulfide interchange protein DsbD
MSGLAPPATYNIFLDPPSPDAEIKAQYPSYTKCANNIDCFKDYFEAVDYAQSNGKPLLLDFTGYGCVNCRKTEEHIWVKDEVRNKLNEDFVLVSLYVDDRKKLEETLISKHRQEKMRSIGNRWADFQIVNFEQNSQPLYVMMTPDEEVIADPRGYREGASDYLRFLKCGLDYFEANN